ncbi:hypothetical protein Slala05_14200 [Streptomyces lavendulae subsp. lavendulae]|nr:hypothetical protein Slala05_14200 [Streptomyces lavendulae subsp. lavendulae]
MNAGSRVLRFPQSVSTGQVRRTIPDLHKRQQTLAAFATRGRQRNPVTPGFESVWPGVHTHDRQGAARIAGVRSAPPGLIVRELTPSGSGDRLTVTPLSRHGYVESTH